MGKGGGEETQKKEKIGPKIVINRTVNEFLQEMFDNPESTSKRFLNRSRSRLLKGHFLYKSY